MNRDQCIAHLILHAWEPIQIQGRWGTPSRTNAIGHSAHKDVFTFRLGSEGVIRWRQSGRRFPGDWLEIADNLLFGAVAALGFGDFDG